MLNAELQRIGEPVLRIASSSAAASVAAADKASGGMDASGLGASGKGAENVLSVSDITSVVP